MNARTLASLTLAVVIGCAGLAPAFAQDAMAGGTGHPVSHDVMDQRVMHEATPADAMTKASMAKPSMEKAPMKRTSMKTSMKHGAMKHDAMSAGH